MLLRNRRLGAEAREWLKTLNPFYAPHQQRMDQIEIALHAYEQAPTAAHYDSLAEAIDAR